MATVRREGVDAGSVARYRTTERRWAMDASDVAALLAGLSFGVLGLLALIDLGVGDYPSEATAEVFGFTVTQVWATISIALGLLYLASAGGRDRSLTIFTSALTLVGGIVIVAAFDQLDPILATETTFGWMAVAVGAVVLLAAIAVPTMSHAERIEDDLVRVRDDAVVSDDAVVRDDVVVRNERI